MNRQEIFDYVYKKHKTTPEYLWVKYPSYAVLRHQDNNKWYGIIMDVPKEKLGLPGSGSAEIMNVKCETEMISQLCRSPGFLPAYHMNKTHWLSILLDGTVSDNIILDFLDQSYEQTA